MERESRSDKYQWQILELTYPSETWQSLDQMQSLRAYQERIDTLRYQMEALINLDGYLWKEMWVMIDTQCTPHQSKIAHLTYEGKTQMEIAAILDVCQSSVHKSLHGNLDYRVSGQAKRYGGLAHKLGKLIPFSGEVHRVMKQMFGMDEQGCTPVYICFRQTFRSWLDFEKWINQ